MSFDFNHSPCLPPPPRGQSVTCSVCERVYFSDEKFPCCPSYLWHPAMVAARRRAMARGEAKGAEVVRA